MRTQVVIIGSGPSGLLLGQLLTRAGIDNVILDRVSKQHVLSRVRAGILEEATCELAIRAGVGTRLKAEGLTHHGFSLAFDDRDHHIDLFDLTGGKSVVVYGQTELTRDLINAREANGALTIYEALDVLPQSFDSEQPFVTYVKNGVSQKLDCDYIVGCDGYHGVSRKVIPEKSISIFEKVYPFGWMGILADVKPVSNELIYVNHSRGFALCSMRSKTRSRYYVQCSLNDRVDAWSDQRFWDELRSRLPACHAEILETAPSFEKSIAPLRSFVAEPMKFGRMFLVGDAAHIVPPTGAKGLNLAASDVHYLFEGLYEYYVNRSQVGIHEYSQKAISRVWKAVRFSWWMTTILHRFPDMSEFDRKIQMAELNYITRSKAAATTLAENYVGLPY